MRPQQSRQPAQILRRPRQAVQQSPPIGWNIQIVDDPEPQNHAQRLEAVLPSDLLAFLVRPPVIADRHFVDAQLPLRGLHGDLRLEAESIRPDGNALQQVRAKHLVAGLHVGHIQIAEHVGNQRQVFVDHRMPVRQHAALLARHVPRSEHRIRPPVEQRTQQLHIFVRIVFEIGVLHQAEIPRRMRDRRPHRRALPLIPLMLNQLDPRVALRQALQYSQRSVGRAIVHHDQLALHVLRQRRGQHHRQAALGHSALVIHGDQDGKKHSESLSIIAYNYGLAPDSRMTTHKIVLETTVPHLKLRARGKVRDIDDDGDRLLFIATDRIAAFDYILATGIPEKGRVLTQMTLFWLEFLRDTIPNHLLSTDMTGLPAELEGLSMWVKRADMIDIECVARGYISGSGWKEYQQTGAVCGIKLPPGLRESDALPEPIFTPATKAQTGHDENISFERMCSLVGGD